MKPIIEHLPLSDDTSFVARTHRTPNFEMPWHQHIEYEIILFTEGAGLSFIGNYVGEFEVGDIFFSVQTFLTPLKKVIIWLQVQL